MAQDISSYQIQLELYRGNGSPTSANRLVAKVPLPKVDFPPLVECAKLQLAIRNPRRPLVLDHEGDVIIEPRWDRQLGRPYVEGFNVSFSDRGASSDQVQVPLSFVTEAAKLATAELVQAGRLVAGDTCRFRVCAYPRDTPATCKSATATGAFDVQPVVEPLAVQEACISEMLARSVAVNAQHKGALAVFVPDHMIGELHALTRAAGAEETGGILVGHLCHDASIPELCVKVTAQIQAVHARQELASLTLTPDTWAAVSAAVALRNLGEIYVGWWHSHPVRQWCVDCPEEKRRTCRLRSDFFSAQDIALHRCCFLRTFCVALVVSDNEENNLTTAMYGWREGTVQRHGFYLLDVG